MHIMVEKFREHCVSLGFNWREGASLISDNPKLLFNISGGVMFEKAIASGIAPLNPRVASIQACLRTDSWNKVGISGRHHLSFDMLGHFSMYELDEEEAKQLMIQTAWSYLVDCVGLAPYRLAATIHPRDQISFEIWQGCGMPTVFYDESNTDTNPDHNKSGLRTEILWQQKSVSNQKNRESYIELWNLVFTQFDGPELFARPMRFIAVDSGASLDRLITASEGLLSDYDNSRWTEQIILIQNQARCAGKSSICRLADMIQSIDRLIVQNLRPGNKAASYVLRKMIRESYLISLNMAISLVEICQKSCRFWIVSDLDSASKLIIEVVEQEVDRFQHCLQQGKRACQRILKKNGRLNEDDLMFLLDTHGFPRELALIEQKRWEA